MPKKSTRNLRESRIGKRLEAGCKIASSEVIVKQFRSIRVNVKNAKRWFMLKKRLALVTDDELVAYLLDLAEPIIGRDGKYSRPVDWKTDQDKENDLEIVKSEERDLLSVEEPLRRSPRKQSNNSAVRSSDSIATVAQQNSDFSKTTEAKFPEIEETENVGSSFDDEKRRSRIKHHRKTKPKHHRDRRTRRKRSKGLLAIDEKNLSRRSDDRAILSRVDADYRETDGATNNSDIRASPVPKIIVERLSMNDRRSLVVSSSCLAVKKNPLLGENDNESTRDRSRINENASRTTMEDKKFMRTTSLPMAQNCENSNELNLTISEEFCDNVNGIDNVENETKSISSMRRTKIDDRKAKKRRKRGSKHDFRRSEEKNEISTKEETILTNKKEISMRKRRKKKHKRASSSSSSSSTTTTTTTTTPRRAKKFHDVRKAPLDGLIVDSAENSNENANSTRKNDANDDSRIGEMRIIEKPLKLEISSNGEIFEPQRLAIKIKLCQNCDERHIKDTCPLVSTVKHIADRLSHDEWLARHKNNSDVARAISIDDPISEGYSFVSDDNYESDDDGISVEQGKSKIKIESEEKQLRINDDRPLYSRESLPDCFELKLTNHEHGIGVYAVKTLPIYAKFGPLVGSPIREMDIPDDFSMRHLWELDDDGKTSYISTTNPLKSNWIRYMRPADTKEDRNVTVVTRNGELYLVATRDIAEGMELTYWADSQSSAWTRKNKIDKTNCGGCNLNFSHSIYYRLHCCIFHDTRYSLTIRKYHCKVCGAAVLGKDNIMKHAADLHGGRGAYQCQYCRKFFLRLNYLEMHRTYGCSQNPQRSRPLCDFCGRKFCQPQKLKVHIKRMHSDMSEVLREFQCKMCLKLLGSRAALQRHMKEVHHKDVVGAATCDRCGKMFQNKSNLKIHMLTHSGVKPFKCKESDCKAAFTTKQCLQFHYKKVHGLSEEMMPKIERSVAYTFDAYSGGLVEDIDRDKRSETRDSAQQSQQENSNSAMSLDDCSSEHSSRAADASIGSFQPTISEFDAAGTVVGASRYNLARYVLDRDEQRENDPQEGDYRDSDLPDYATDNREFEEDEKRVRENAHDREIRQSSPASISSNAQQHRNIQITESSSVENEPRATADIDFYGMRLASKGSKKWMGQFVDTSDNELIVDQDRSVVATTATRNPEVYEFGDTAMRKRENDADVTCPTSNELMSGDSKLGMNIYRRTESTNASLLVEAALDAAERDIGAVASPIIDENERETGLYGLSSQLQTQQADVHLDSYMPQDELLSASSSISQENRKSPNSHVHGDYHLHRSVDYINSSRTHCIEQYLPQEELTRVVSPVSYNIHMQQNDIGSPSATPDQNHYQEIHHHRHHHHHHQQDQDQQDQHNHHHHHHRVPTDNLSSDEGDSVAQNLSISVKEKSLQLDPSASYKYEQLETEFSRDRANFEPIVLNNGELQGLDMSARSYHHGHGGQSTNSRYHHHLYELTDRQSVDLSRATGYAVSSPSQSTLSQSPASGYPHGEISRIVSLDLTPGHSVDLSLARSHHLHTNGSRNVTGSPQPPVSSGSHVVPETLDGRISPPPSLTGYSAAYPVSPAAYHPPRPGYHHYSGYY